ncbi:uncharacterized protein METZ01_LOCUS163337, partial [marine metagenome]
VSLLYIGMPRFLMRCTYCGTGGLVERLGKLTKPRQVLSPVTTSYSGLFLSGSISQWHSAASCVASCRN